MRLNFFFLILFFFFVFCIFAVTGLYIELFIESILVGYS